MFQKFLCVIIPFISMQNFLIDQQGQHQYYLWVWRVKTASWKKKTLGCWILTPSKLLIGYGITVLLLLHHCIPDFLLLIAKN
jgi:nitrate reductase gamma subunit